MLTDDREVDVVGVCSQGICVSNVDDDTIISDDGVDFQAVAVADWPTLSTTWIGEEATDGGGTGSWDPVQVVPGYIDVYALDDNGDIHHKPIQGGQPWYIWSYGPAGGATQIDVDGTSMWVTADDNTYHKLLSDTNYKSDSWTLVDDSDNGLHVSANGAYLWQVMDDGMFGANWDVGYKIGAGDGSYGAMTAKKLPDSMNDSMKMVSVSGGAGSETPDGVSYVWGVSQLGDIYRTLSDGSAEWEKLSDDLGGIEWNWISAKGRKNIWATKPGNSDAAGVYKCSKPCEGVAGKIPWEKIHAGGLLTNITGSPYTSSLDDEKAANQVWGVNSDNNMFTLSQQ
jgi:hypothetical protein